MDQTVKLAIWSTVYSGRCSPSFIGFCLGCMFLSQDCETQIWSKVESESWLWTYSRASVPNGSWYSNASTALGPRLAVSCSAELLRPWSQKAKAAWIMGEAGSLAHGWPLLYVYQLRIELCFFRCFESCILPATHEGESRKPRHIVNSCILSPYWCTASGKNLQHPQKKPTEGGKLAQNIFPDASQDATLVELFIWYEQYRAMQGADQADYWWVCVCIMNHGVFTVLSANCANNLWLCQDMYLNAKCICSYLLQIQLPLWASPGEF